MIPLAVTKLLLVPTYDTDTARRIRESLGRRCDDHIDAYFGEWSKATVQTIEGIGCKEWSTIQELRDDPGDATPLECKLEEFFHRLNEDYAGKKVVCVLTPQTFFVAYKMLGQPSPAEVDGHQRYPANSIVAYRTDGPHLYASLIDPATGRYSSFAPVAGNGYQGVLLSRQA